MEFVKQDLLDCHEKIKPYIHRTPVYTSSSINRLVNAEVFFKCENFQRAGSFKIRGATHAICCLTDEQKRKGIVAHSSGNFAQAVALAAKSVGTHACIAMPSSAPKVKMEATAAYGGEIVLTGPRAEDREQAAASLVAERGATFLHPSNDLNVILGQGTSAMELIEEVPDVDTILVPVGGGGLIAGCSLAAHFFGKQCVTIGAEPMAVDDAFRSLESGKIEFNESVDTIADGLRTFLGDNNFPIIQKHVERIVRVEEDEIVDAMKLIWQRMKFIIEPSCAVPFAAMIREPEHFVGKKVGLVLTGGNVDLENLPF
ncbi:MAG: threonine/serine dehydratase [Planctomycetota bacterium]